MNSFILFYFIFNSFEVKGGSFLSPGYALFKIVTKSIDSWTVHRRFSEFYSLRTYFVKSFPGVMVSLY